MKKPYIHLVSVLLMALPVMAVADSRNDVPDHKRRPAHREFKEEYWDGNCKVEREAKKDGEYKEKRECKGVRHSRREFKDEYWDGNCKVEREATKDGEYKEKRECKSPKHGHYAPAPPPVIVEPGISIHGTVRLP